MVLPHCEYLKEILKVGLHFVSEHSQLKGKGAICRPGVRRSTPGMRPCDLRSEDQAQALPGTSQVEWMSCNFLGLCFPIEHSAVMEMLQICYIQCGSHYPHTTVKHLKWGYENKKQNYIFILICLNLNNHMWLRANFLESAVLEHQLPCL